MILRAGIEFWKGEGCVVGRYVVGREGGREWRFAWYGMIGPALGEDDDDGISDVLAMDEEG